MGQDPSLLIKLLIAAATGVASGMAKAITEHVVGDWLDRIEEWLKDIFDGDWRV